MNKKQQGMTLLELTVVLLILLALAGLAIPYVGGTSGEAMCKTNDVSMVNIKKAIMNGYYIDTLGKFPQDLDGLTPNPTFADRDYNLHYLFSDTNFYAASGDKRVHKSFNPNTQTGWRAGGYLQNGSHVDKSLADEWKNLVMNGHTVIYKDLDSDNLIDDNEIYISILDAWGRPFVLQVIQRDSSYECWGVNTTEKVCARILSAGKEDGLGMFASASEDGVWFETTTGNKPANSDDRILYLNIPTPAGDVNEDCSRY
jgi:prepilin-type N-terminal cleavage/methylation domain-containing protein